LAYIFTTMNKYILCCLVFIALLGCIKVDEYRDLTYDKEGVEIAFPLFHSSLNISELASSLDAETSIEIQENNEIDLLYRGQIIEGGLNQIFPPVIGFGDIQISDTSFLYTVPINFWEEIITLTMGKTSLTFKFSDRFEQPVDIILEIPEMQLNGQPFVQQFKMTDGNFISQPISVEDYTITPDDLSFLIKYQALDEEGNTILMDNASFTFDFFQIKYIEGIFSPRLIDVQGDVIQVGLFDNWRSGGLTFSEPELYIRVENSFGIQAISQNNTINIVTTEGELLPLESPLLTDGVSFNYPTLSEIGEVKITEFIFDKNNSNLGDLFSGKAAKIEYDLDALINNKATNEVGFLSEDGFFKIEPIVRLPMTLTVEELILADKTDFDGSALEDLTSATVQWYIINDFPVDMALQGFLYQSGILRDSLFVEPLFVEAAIINGNNQHTPSEMIYSESYSQEDLLTMRRADSIEVIGKFNSLPTSVSVTIYNDYYLSIDAGMKASLK